MTVHPDQHRDLDHTLTPPPEQGGRSRTFGLFFFSLALSLLAAVSVEFLLKRNSPSSPDAASPPAPPPLTTRIITPPDAEALFFSRGRPALYDNECLAQHSLFLSEQSARMRREADALGMSDDAVSGYILAASEAVDADEAGDLARLDWVPPTDVLLSKPGSCSTYPRRTAEASSLLFYAVEGGSDGLALLCVRRAPDGTVDAADDRLNLLMKSSSRGLNRTFAELVRRGADPFYRSNGTNAVAAASILAQFPGGYAPVPVGAASWLEVAASVRFPPRAYLAKWVEVQYYRKADARSQETLAGLALEVGLRFVREGIVVNDATERELTLARLNGCRDPDLVFAGADAEAHPELFDPWPGWMRPLDVAIAGACAKSLDLLSDMGYDVQSDLLEPCPQSAGNNNTAAQNPSPCGARVAFREYNSYYKEGFYCDTGQESPRVEALDLLLLREDVDYRYHSSFADELQKSLDVIATRILDALDSAKRPYSTGRLGLLDVLTISACGLALPSATRRILESGGQEMMFGNLSKTWSEKTLAANYTTVPGIPEMTPSLILQCVLQRHPPSADRDLSEGILRDSHGATVLRPDLLPVDPRHPGLLDALRINMTAAEHILQGNVLLQKEDLVDADYGTGANAFHAFFNNYRVNDWCLPHKDVNITSNGALNKERTPAERVWELLAPMKHKDLLSASIAATVLKPRPQPSTPLGCKRDEFCYDREADEQCFFLANRMPSSQFGRTDVVLETMLLQLHKAMRNWAQAMSSPPKMKSYSLTLQHITYNALTPLSFAFARASGLRLYTKDRHCAAVNIIRDMSREGMGLCDGEGAYFDWNLLGGSIESTRDPALAQEVLESNHKAFCGKIDAEPDVYRQNISPPDIVVQWLKGGAFGPGPGKAFYAFVAYLIGIYPTLCGAEAPQPENVAAFAARLASASFRPSTRVYEEDTATQVETVNPLNPLNPFIWNSTFQRLDENRKGEALSVCVGEDSLSYEYETIWRSFATRAILEGFARRPIGEGIASVHQAAKLENPIIDCTEDVAPFWEAIQLDLSNSRVRQTFGMARLQMSSRIQDNRIECPWGGEGALAEKIMLRSGKPPPSVSPTLILAWGFTELLPYIDESGWTIDVVKDGVRERNIEWISEVPVSAKKWLVDAEVVAMTEKLPILRAQKIFDTSGHNLTSIPDKHWVRVYELLDAVAGTVGQEFDVIQWLFACASSRDFFPVVDSSDRHHSFDDIRRREIRNAAKTFAKHLGENRASHELDSLLMSAAMSWDSSYITDLSTKDSPEDPESLLMVNVLLEAGANASAVFTFEDERGEARTTTVLEAAGVLTEVVSLRLLDAGARPQYPSDFLCLALFRGKAKIVQQLVEFVDVSLPSTLYKGLMPLHCAACSIAPTQYTVIDAVLAKGGDKKAVANFTGRDDEYGSLIHGTNSRPLDLYNDQSLCEAVFGAIVWSGQPRTEEIRQRLSPDSDSQ